MKPKRDWVFIMGQVLIYLAAFILIFWALAKIFGLINTPLWITMMPVLAGGIGLLGFGVNAGKLVQRVERLVHDVGKLDQEMREMDKKVTKLTVEVHAVSSRVDILTTRMDSLTSRIISLETKLS